MIDIGAGTLDLLYYDTAKGEHFKAVIKSPVRTKAAMIENTSGNLVVTGVEMGGGRVSAALKARAATHSVAMTREAAATLHHDLKRVAAAGIAIVSAQDARRLSTDPAYTPLSLADLEPDRLRRIVEGLGVPFEFDIIGVCAQDHGVAPQGVSHLDYRHRLFAQALNQSPFPHALIYPKDKIPASFNRLRSLARAARDIPAKEIYVMDSGMAAIQGACCDPLCRSLARFMVLDIATSHTVGAALIEGEIAGFFEYHTHDITAPKLDRLLQALPEGRLAHAAILEEGGHGAYSRRQFAFFANEIILATGPKRALMIDAKLPYVDGAPWGDNMMTGTVGLLEAIRKYKENSKM